MKSLGLVGVYVAALGAIAAGNASDLWNDDLDGLLVLVAASLGLIVFTINALRKDDS